jgi:hypothetical protein
MTDVFVEWERRTVALPPAAEIGRELFRERVSLAGLEEHVVWRRVSDATGLVPDKPAYGVFYYVFTEMLNNAIDHSGGVSASVEVRARGEDVVATIADDGVGIFEHLRAHLDLPDDQAAILELTKGKRTTDPDHHTGEGIFFSSRAVAVFSLEANGLTWVVDNRRGDQAVGESDTLVGTKATFVVPRAGARLVEDVFAEFVDEDFRFSKTRPSVKLAEIGTDFVSRSEAKRLMAGLEKFEEVELDFAGVTRVGQGFVDEVFRVWQKTHPDTRLVPVRMVEPVEFMLRRSAEFGTR